MIIPSSFISILEIKGDKMTVADTTVVQVQNLVDHIVGYKIEEDNVRRIFQPYEIKKLTAGELRKLNYRHGGNVMLRNFLSVKNKELAREFGVEDDTVEYNWTVKDVDEVLTNGDMDTLLDALDFGPEGIKSMLVDRAVTLKINDMDKRQAIYDKTGYNISKMIEFEELAQQDDDNSKTSNSSRRVKKTNGESRTRRKQAVQEE